MFPMAEEPDFVISLGTGEPDSYSVCATRTPPKWRNKALPRLCRLLWEKTRDRKIRQAFRLHPRYHRLDIALDEVEPRLDDVRSMSELKSKVQRDGSLSTAVDSVVRCMVASLFYFELESIPETVDGQSIAVGHIQCSVRSNSPAFPLLLRQLLDCSAAFYLDDDRISGTMGDGSYLGADGNFRKRIELNIRDRFTLSLKQGNSEPCNISGSPYSIERLISVQGLNAYLGTANHRKRRQGDSHTLGRKKRRIM